MREARILLLLPALLIVTGAAMGEDWPTYQHDRRRSAATAEKLDAPALAEVWRWQSPSPPTTAWHGPAKWDAYASLAGLKSMRQYDQALQPIVAGDRAYLNSSADDSVRCFDLRTGKLVWVFTTDAPIRIAPTFADGRVYFGSDDGHVYCVKAVDGTLIWKVRASDVDAPPVLHNGRLISRWPVRSGVLVDGGTAYFAASMLPWDGAILAAVDAATGKADGPGRFIRKFDGAYTFEGPLLASADQLFTPQGRISPLVFRRDNGDPLGQIGGAGGGSFVLLTEDNRLLHGPGNKHPTIYESDTGRRAAIANFAGGNAIVVAGDRSYLLTDSELAAVDRANRARLWTVKCEHPHTMILAGSTLYAGGDDSVAAYDTADGKLIWSAPVSGRAYAIAVANGALLVSTEEGTLHCFRADASRPAPIAQSKDTAAESIDPAVLAKFRGEKPDANLLGRWVFDPDLVAGASVAALAGEINATPDKAKLQRVGEWGQLTLDGGGRAVLAPDIAKLKMPREAITAAAWVRVDQPAAWGSFISAIQDNGAYEYGWLLGYTNDRFCLAIATDKANKLTYMPSPQPFKAGAWHHVAGTYDGATMRLYVDGVKVAESAEQSGPVRYPPKAFYEIGAYHDDDENYLMRGAIHEVAVYDRVLSAEQIAALHAARKDAAPAAGSPEVNREKVHVAVGPFLRFDSPTAATVRWRSEKPEPTKLTLSGHGKPREINTDQPTTEHAVQITGLRRNRVYNYSIATTIDGKEQAAGPFECDTFFYYGPPTMPETDKLKAMATDAGDAAGKSILERTQVDRGIAVLLGVDQLPVAIALARTSQLRTIVLDDSADRVAAARKALIEADAYGARVSVRHVVSLDKPGLNGAFANLVIAAADAKTPADVLLDLAQPAGGKVVRLDGSNIKSIAARPAIDGAGEWSHQYATAANGGFGGESLGGATASADMRVQWVGRPGPRYQTDRQVRGPAPIAVAGRLFVQGHFRIIAMDHYNGTILWSHENPRIARFNVPRDSSNWCADEKNLYLAVGDRVWQIDAATGELTAAHETPAPEGRPAPHGWDAGYVARTGDFLLTSAVRRDSAFVDWWGGTNWYDEKDGPHAAKVCSDSLIARQVTSGAIAWRHTGGLILNTTITADESTISFIESRHAGSLAGDARRLNSAEFWSDLHVVCLDTKSGQMKWERPLAMPGGDVAFYMARGSGRLVIASSTAGNYHVKCLDAVTGEEKWAHAAPWTDGRNAGAAHHGTHLSRPAIVGQMAFVRPYAFNLADGARRPHAIPLIAEGHGCGSYAATANALIFRSGELSMWNFESGKKTTWTRLRPNCWVSTIPAGGMLLSPEAGGGCSCGTWMETSIGFIPAAAKR